MARTTSIRPMEQVCTLLMMANPFFLLNHILYTWKNVLYVPSVTRNLMCAKRFPCTIMWSLSFTLVIFLCQEGCGGGFYKIYVSSVKQVFSRVRRVGHLAT
jgi:hypothetical protein